METPVPTRRQLLTMILPACVGIQPGLAANRRGAKLYPDKETTADMSGVKTVFVGWADFKEDDWAMHGYTSKPEWANVNIGLNGTLLQRCQVKLVGKTVDGAKQKGDENSAGHDLYIKISDVLVDYNKYHLYMSLHFIDPKANTELGVIPVRPYFGNDWGLVNYLKAALDEASDKVKVEILGNEDKKKRKIPLIGKKG